MIAIRAARVNTDGEPRVPNVASEPAPEVPVCAAKVEVGVIPPRRGQRAVWAGVRARPLPTPAPAFVSRTSSRVASGVCRKSCRKIVASSARALAQTVGETVRRPLRREQSHLDHCSEVPLKAAPADSGAEGLEVVDGEPAAFQHPPQGGALAV